MPETAPCRSCKTQVLWTKSAANNRPMPLDEAPDSGNVLVDGMGRAHVYRDHDTAMAELERDPEGYSTVTYVSHHAQCPQGQAWRAKKRTDADAPKPASPQGSLL
jgi:hypothetical protein